jgi:hypothetical protein
MKRGQTKRNRAFRVKIKPSKPLEDDSMKFFNGGPVNTLKLRGHAPDVWAMNMALFGTADPDAPPLGFNYSELWDKVKPRLIDGNRVTGKALIVGTGGLDRVISWESAYEFDKLFAPATPNPLWLSDEAGHWEFHANSYNDHWKSAVTQEIPPKMGSSMMEQLKESIERTSKLTDQEKEENLRNFLDKSSKRE